MQNRNRVSYGHHGTVNLEPFYFLQSIHFFLYETKFVLFFSNDKFILKVIANTEALLALVGLDPEFVSQNEHDGRDECDVIFPLGYISISEDEAEAEMKFEGLLEDDEGEEGKAAEEGELDTESKVDSTAPNDEVESIAATEDGDKSVKENVEKVEAEGSEVAEALTTSVKGNENNDTEKSNTE